jgi:hypothetical protein
MMIDNKVVEQARNADVIAFLERRGFTFTECGGAFRCEQHKSLAVKNDRLSWYWHNKSIGGFGVLDYLVKAENMPFREAVETVTGVASATVPPRRETQLQKTLILPEKAGITLRLYDYLCVKRGIAGGIVNMLIQKEKLYEDRRGNVVFVGHDGQGTARFASLRGTRGGFRGDCAGSDKRYGFNMAFSPSERLYVFESPIDTMSHASLENAAAGDKNAWKRPWPPVACGNVRRGLAFLSESAYRSQGTGFLSGQRRTGARSRRDNGAEIRREGLYCANRTAAGQRLQRGFTSLYKANTSRETPRTPGH